VRLDVVGDVAPRSAEGSALVESVRAVPWSGESLVGGAAAEYADSQAAIAATLPLALGWVFALTLVVLFLYTGSVVLPIKAVLLNILSLGATIGALVWVFQDDNLGWLVGDYQSTGTLDTSMTVLIAIVAFALSMDYEVFLLSRIKEEHDAGADTGTAVELGLQRSGRIITAAAVLLAIVFASFITSGVTPIKQLGFGVAFAILLDATVIRGLLVPAFMRLAGRWNWWAPAPLAALHRRVGLSEG
jgi:RND superfamily putative drug exporter